MTAFFCDLDNTLIYGKQSEIGSSKVAVEQYQGEDISFMTTATVTLLQQVCQKVCFIPVTTRSQAQYERICFPCACPTYALVCNGGILLYNGAFDETWYQTTKALVASSRATMARAEILLQNDKNRSSDVRFLNDLFLFTKSKHPLETKQWLSSHLDLAQVNVFSQNAKIYVLPKLLTKAGATVRLRQQLSLAYTFAAGDSVMDSGMLREADCGFAPSLLAQQTAFESHVKIIPQEQIFSESILHYIIR